jgi:hypothetical protein
MAEARKTVTIVFSDVAGSTSLGIGSIQRRFAA